MISVELKIIITIIVMWIITHFAAYPTTAFARWGRRQFKSYLDFLIAIGLFYMIPFIGVGLYYVWSL